MREALARTDFDFTVSETGRGARGERRPTRLPRVLRIASVATTGIVSTAILLNALFLQDRKHPAPLLRVPEAAAPLEAPPAAAVSSPRIAMPVAKTPSRDVIAEQIGRLGGAEVRKAKPVAAPVDDDKSDRVDAIAGLLGGGADPAVNVLATQKALLRLGYVLRADGTAGATTRQAVLQYEKDNKLPPRGELTAKIARDIAARAARLGH